MMSACSLLGPSDRSDPNLHTVIIMNQDLGPLLRVENQKGFYDPGHGEIFIAETTIKNLSSQSLILEARTLFKDDTGVTVEVSPWKSMTLTSKSEAIYHAPTLKPTATRFMTQIRRAYTFGTPPAG